MSRISSPKVAVKQAAARKFHGVSVSFRKRVAGGSWTMDFRVGGERFQEATGWPTLPDAERVAEKRVREVKELKQGLQAAGLSHQKAKGKAATVGEVVAALETGGKVWDVSTARAYKSSLLRLARVVDAVAPLEVSLSEVLAERSLERFYALGQGLPAVNWADALPVNGGLNKAIRDVRALFRPRVLKLKFADLKMPDLRPLRDLPFLRVEVHGFVPWPAAVYERMHQASEALRESKPELWLVNALLRRLGLRDEELLMARREWIELQEEWAADGMGPPLRRGWLVIQNRGSEFQILKHGRSRRLELDGELLAVLLRREGYLVGDGWTDNARYNLIYRLHSEWLRAFIPERTKSNHELRMWAGSQIYTRHGLEAAAYFLGHKSTATTERYYAAWLGESPMLDGAAVALGRGMRRAA